MLRSIFWFSEIVEIVWAVCASVFIHVHLHLSVHSCSSWFIFFHLVWLLHIPLWSKEISFWSFLISFDLIWSHLISFDVFWCLLMSFDPFDLFGSHLMSVDLVWCLLISFIRFWFALICLLSSFCCCLLLSFDGFTSLFDVCLLSFYCLLIGSDCFDLFRCLILFSVVSHVFVLFFSPELFPCFCHLSRFLSPFSRLNLLFEWLFASHSPF